MPNQPNPRKLRKREIAFAVALGGLAAGAAALIVGGSDDSRPAPVAITAEPQTFDLADFDEIRTMGSQQVVVTFGDTQSVRSEGSPEALGQLEVVVEGGELIIRPKDESSVDWDSLSSATFHVTLPDLDAVALDGSGNMRIDRIAGESFTATIEGSGELTIADMKVEEAEFSIGGSGTITAAGSARETSVEIGGSGDVKAEDLRSEEASVEIAGSGNVALTVQDEARVEIAGAGDVDISGPARCSVSNVGGGEVQCGGGGGE
jgi:hypothetical protein